MFSDELEKISWEETTKAIYSKTDADVRRALSKEHCDVNDFMALISAGCRSISGDDGTSQPEVYDGTLRKNNLDVRASLYYKFLYKLVCILRL